MKIVHIITRLIVGGAQENTLLSCQGQHDRGHQVTLITGPALGPEGSLLPRAQSYGYNVQILDEMRRPIHPRRDWHTYRWLVQYLRQFQPDIVHTHSSKAGIIGRKAAHQAGVPAIIHTIHGLSFTASTVGMVNAGYRVLERMVAPLSTRIICVADAMAQQSLAAGIGRADQYVTVYSGMETSAFLTPPVAPQTVRQRLNLRTDDLVVGTIARLFDLKGHDDLLAAAPRLCQQFPHLRFLWVGDGTLRPRFEQQIAQMGLTDRFILTGLVPPQQIPELANAMDILIHPSRREGLARALAQGQLAGKPVITYDIDGNREGLIDGQTGFCVPPFDRPALTARLAQLLADAPLRQQMGPAGRQFALARFDAPVMIQGLERVYNQALKESRRSH